jgi:hypothetical protein
VQRRPSRYRATVGSQSPSRSSPSPAALVRSAPSSSTRDRPASVSRGMAGRAPSAGSSSRTQRRPGRYPRQPSAPNPGPPPAGAGASTPASRSVPRTSTSWRPPPVPSSSVRRCRVVQVPSSMRARLNLHDTSRREPSENSGTLRSMSALSPAVSSMAVSQSGGRPRGSSAASMTASPNVATSIPNGPDIVPSPSSSTEH